MAPPLIVRAILDATEYLKVNKSIISSNTLAGESALGMGADFTKSAEATVAAGVKVIQSQRAQLAQLQALSAAAVAGSDERIAADVAVARAQTVLNRSTGVSTVATAQMGAAVQKGERDLGKLTRGALAGSGVFSKLGRSLAFASSGFIAVAGGATIIAESLRQAESLAAAQRQVDRQLKTSGKSWDQYGATIDKTLLKEGHLAGFTRTQLLQAFGYLLRVGGNVKRSLDLTGLAADVARGRSISLQAASIALSKALGGSATALRRLGIIVPNNVTKMQALEYVQKKFAGQAAAGTTESDRLGASLADAGATIGTVLLPTFDRLARGISDSLTKMQKSGELTRDVATVTHVLGLGFHALGDAIAVVDKITGGLSNTLKILIGVVLTRWAAKAVFGIDKIAASWLGVAGAANTAAAAEERATLTGEAGAAGASGASGAGGIVGAGLLGGLAARRGAAQAASSEAAVSRISRFTGTMVPAEEAVAGVGVAAAASTTKVAALSTSLGALGLITIAPIVIPIAFHYENKAGGFLQRHLGRAGQIIKDIALPTSFKDFTQQSLFNDLFRYKSPAQKAADETAAAIEKLIIARLQSGQFGPGRAFTPGGTLGRAIRAPSGASAPGRPFGSATPIPVYTSYTEPIGEQIAGAQAALTKTIKDDVANAKRIIASIKRGIDRGHYAGASLVQALQAEAAAISTIESAQAAAAQKRAAAAQAAKQRILTQIQNAIDPIKLQIAFARAESLGQSTLPALRAQLKAAYKGLALAIANGNKQLILQAYQQISSLKDAIKSALTSASAVFTISPKLALDIARDQALGKGIRDDLIEERKALYKWIAHHRKNIQGVTDAYNQITAINSQLNSDIGNAYGDYKKASLKWETQGLGLTRAQREALEARLSQVGPGGTHPMSGTGAAGFIIDPDTGRPIHRNHRRRGSQYSGGGGGGKPPTVNANIDLNVYIDGHQVEATITKRQQRNNQRRPTQRRGPNAATR